MDGKRTMANDRRGQFDALVAPHMERLFRVACRLLGNAHDAQDLVQDTCVAACENLTGLAASPHPLRWLLRVQHNRFIDGARRRQRGPMVAMDVTARAANLASAAPGPEDLLQQADAERAFERAFLALEDTQRTLLSLRAEGYGLDEIESITGISREVLRARLHRARRSLAQRLDEQPDAPRRASLSGSGTT
jgi:RNA polymerase sigma-70 factor (ECF subfamily)